MAALPQASNDTPNELRWSPNKEEIKNKAATKRVEQGSFTRQRHWESLELI